jgi:outer membrane phospholipase A
MRKTMRTFIIAVFLLFTSLSYAREHGVTDPVDLPWEMTDPVQTELRDADTNRMESSGTAPEDSNPESMMAPRSSKENKYRDYESLFTLYQPYLVNIEAYEPIYFLVGVDPKQSKFQLSLKYRFFNADNPSGAKHPWLQGIHFGYTQTSFWDLGSTSAPFDDTSYKPELFYLTGNQRWKPSWLQGLYFQGGVQHESNGRAGSESRGTNCIYTQPILIFYDAPTRLGFMVAPKVWAYFDREYDTNPDLDEYRGNFDLELKFGKADSLVVGTNLRWGGKGPSVQMDLTYPLHLLFFKNMDLYFHVQYVNSLAESLIDYKERTVGLRLGFAIVR